MQSIAGLTLPQELAATLFGLIYLSYFGFDCRWRAERNANITFTNGETAGNLFPSRSEQGRSGRQGE